MADTDILVPGEGGMETCSDVEVTSNEVQYLQKDNYLGEFESTDDKAIARTNLGVPALEDVYNKTETTNEASRVVQEAMQNHLNDDDPHSILPQVETMISGMVKSDGSVAFTSPQTGVDPVQAYHLTTKQFVETLLNSHISASDPHNIMSLVNEALLEYVKASQVYLKSETYTKAETSSLFNDYVRTDGTTSFKRPQLGIDPVTDGHLTTKRYVDNLIQQHLVEIDPHGFISTLNNRLSRYYKKTETYSRAETYSRQQIDSIINSLVRDAAQSVMDEHIHASDPHGTLKAVQNEHYVKRDGSVPFTAPQSGVAAVNDSDFVTYGQIKQWIGDPENPGEGDLINGGCEGWKTSGPVQTTVGFVEDNSVLPEHLTCQEIFDMIFYGKGISIVTPEYWAGSEGVPVEMSIHGSLADIVTIELYQGDQLIGTYESDLFENGTYNDTSLPLTEDPTIFTLKVCYLNGTCLEATSTTKIGYFTYVGLLPKWYTGSNITLEYLQELINTDPTNNIQVMPGENTIVHRYSFSSPADPKHIFIMVPKDDGKELYQMSTPSQQFGIDAFDVIEDLPLVYPNGTTKVYTAYIYREAITGLNNVEVTFKFDE